MSNLICTKCKTKIKQSNSLIYKDQYRVKSQCCNRTISTRQWIK